MARKNTWREGKADGITSVAGPLDALPVAGTGGTGTGAAGQSASQLKTVGKTAHVQEKINSLSSHLQKLQKGTYVMYDTQGSSLFALVCDCEQRAQLQGSV